MRRTKGKSGATFNRAQRRKLARTATRALKVLKKPKFAVLSLQPIRELFERATRALEWTDFETQQFAHDMTLVSSGMRLAFMREAPNPLRECIGACNADYNQCMLDNLGDILWWRGTDCLNTYVGCIDGCFHALGPRA